MGARTIPGRIVLCGLVGGLLSFSTWAQSTGGWREVTPTPRPEVHAVASDGAQFVIVGEPGLALTSTDGTTWQRRATGSDRRLRALVWTGTELVAGGEGGVILRSPDGVNWLKDSAALSGEAWRLGWDGKQLLALLADGTLWTSRDGGAWVRRAAGLGSVYNVATNGRVTVAVGDVIIRSEDGERWERVSAPDVGQLGAVAWTDSSFVAGGDEAKYLVSADGRSWWQQSLPVRPCIGIDCNMPPDFGGLFAVGGETSAFAYSSGNVSFWYSLRSRDLRGWFRDEEAPYTQSGPMLYRWIPPVADLAACGQSVAFIGESGVWLRPIAARTVLVPIAAHLEGLAGTVWRTDLEIVNRGGGVASYTLELLRRGQENLVPAQVTRTLQPGASTRYRDVVASAFGTNGAGAVRITPMTGDLRVSSRTFNNTVAGTAGQFVPSLEVADAFRQGRKARLVGLAQAPTRASGSRTNLGVVNLTAAPLEVGIELYAASGALLGRRNEHLRAWEPRQLDEILRPFATGAIVSAYAVLRTPTVGGTFVAYATVVDNRSGDAVFALAR